MRRRADRRRTARDAAVETDGTVAAADELLAQAHLYRVLVDLVLALDEPYRSTVLARFVEGRSAVDIARTAGVPAGTVRWRLNEALRRLRDGLDARAKRRVWTPLLGSSARWASIAKVVGVIAAAICIAIPLRGRRDLEPPPGSPATASSSTNARKQSADDSIGTNWLVPANATTRSIAGRVVTDNGQPVGGAIVQLQSWASVLAGRDEARAVTAADGTFQFAPRWATDYVVVASAPDRASSSVSVDPRAPFGSSDPQHLVVMLPSCEQRAEGIVSDAGGGPIASAEVHRLLAGYFGPFGAATTTAADGHYTLCLPRGTNLLDFGADGYEHVLRRVTARGRQRVDVALAPGSSMTGRLIDATTGQPAAGAWIAMLPLAPRRFGRSRRSKHGQRNTDGTFKVDGLSWSLPAGCARSRSCAEVSR